MIQFKCPVCDRCLRIPADHAGRQGRCPGCRERITVPAATIEPETPLPGSGLRLREEHLESPPLIETMDPPVTDSRADSSPPGIRKYPAPLDVLFYPTSVPGLINVIIFWILLPSSALITTLPLMRMRLIGAGLGLIVMGYYFCYLADCVRDSAIGGTRAPESLGTLPDIWDAVTQALYVWATVALLVLPGVGVYFWRGPDPLFWTLVVTGVLLLPMAMLSTVMLDSISILYPWLWISSITNTLFPYLGLLILIYLPFVPWLLLLYHPGYLLALMPVQIYLSMISAHLLGRFFFRYEERLRWEA